jgi:hypothetical protein
MEVMDDGAGGPAAPEWGGLATQFWRYYNYLYALGCLAGRRFHFLRVGEKIASGGK